MSLDAETVPHGTPCCVALKTNVRRPSNEIAIKNIKNDNYAAKNKVPEKKKFLQ